MKLAYERIFEVYDAENTTIPRELKKAYYYDKRDRVIQTVTQYPDGILCRTSTKYDYAGNPLITLEKYTYNNKPLTIRTERTFDERSRQLTEQTTIDGAIVSNATFSYDELGRMKRLELGDNVAINTSYNLQGWIDAISSVSSSSGDGQVLSEDIFTERLSYYDPVDANSTPRYSGKISEQRWAHGSIMNGFKGFAYAYDNIGRLTDAQLFTSSQNNAIANNIREQISYDKNSNVIRLSDTRGLSTTTRNYVVQGNQVVQMIVNGNNLGYPVYDERGNMTQNVETGLQMSYNLCNLPKQITAANGISVKYSYFADGTKFKAVSAAGNGFAYTGSLRWSVENGVLTLESIAITGGRVVFTDNSWATNYYITDHLGSVRAVTDAEGEVLDTFDYMPYGSEISSTSSTTTDYRFTGKERQSIVNNSIYDSFARFQNTYGRFMSIDPKAESFYHISPYTYCAGDPVNLVDPDGEAWKPTMHSNLIDGTSYYTGFEWIDESESYDENGNLKQGLFRQAIFFSDNMTFDSSNVYNIGSSTAYVYLESGVVVTYDACTHPSGPNYPTIPEKLVEATYGLHGGKYNALRMHDFGNASSQIYLGFENPAHKGRDYIEGANIHKAGYDNKTGMATDGRPISAGCFLIDRNQWKSFISHFNRSSKVGVVASRNGVKIPINQNTCQFRIIPFTYELFD